MRDMCLPLRVCKESVNGSWKAVVIFTYHVRPEYIAIEESANPYMTSQSQYDDGI